MSRRRGSEEDGGVGVLFVGEERRGSNKFCEQQRLFLTDVREFPLAYESLEVTGGEGFQCWVAHMNSPVLTVISAHNPAVGFYRNHLVLTNDTATNNRWGVTDGYTAQLNTHDDSVSNGSTQCFRMV